MAVVRSLLHMIFQNFSANLTAIFLKLIILMVLRYIKLGTVVSIAIFFSLVSFDNLIDFTSNLPAVQHVLSMDTTFHVPILMRRSITNPSIQLGAYYLIIAWELLTAISCWIGSFLILFNINASDIQFNNSKTVAFIGLFLGFLLYIVGFIVIGGEWFCMWQSHIWNAQPTAGLFVSLIMFVMIFLALPS
jgi:predicted small integral membrane protein